MELQLHLFGVTDKNQLWHSIGRGKGQWDPLGDVDRQVGSVEAGRTIVDAACATDSKGNFHVLVLADNGGLWYTARLAVKEGSHEVGDWLLLENLREAQKPAANIGKINAVGATTDGMTLFALAATKDQKLYRAIRKPDGQKVSEGTWTEPFKQIKPGPGRTPPPSAPFTVFVGALFKKP